MQIYILWFTAIAYLEVGKMGDAEVVDAVRQDPGGWGRVASRRLRRRHDNTETRSIDRSKSSRQGTLSV